MLSEFSARRQQRRNAREMLRRLNELDRLDRLHGLGAMPTGTHRRPRQRRRSHGPALPGLLITALLLTAIVALSPSETMRSVRRLIGFDDDRLAAAPDVPLGVGSYAFMQTQQFSDEPVAYDPCRVIEVVVNPEDAPAGYDRLVDTAIQHTSEATGLRFERVGLTDDRDVTGPGLARRRPVLMMWADSKEVPELEGDIAGIGGSIAVDPGTGRMRYVTGRVVLDEHTFAGFTDEEQPFAQAIVDHEFGHVVGLDHVEDPNELMHEDNVGMTTYGPGDREGLARLGSVAC